MGENIICEYGRKYNLWYWFFIQGVECFDYSHTLNVICTGGVDHAVRLWNPYVTVKPVAIMKGHQSSIIDLAIYEALEQVFSYDKDGVRNTKRIFIILSNGV